MGDKPAFSLGTRAREAGNSIPYAEGIGTGTGFFDSIDRQATFRCRCPGNGERVSLSFDLPCRQAPGHSARYGEGPPHEVDNFSGVLRGRECLDLLARGLSFHELPQRQLIVILESSIAMSSPRPTSAAPKFLGKSLEIPYMVAVPHAFGSISRITRARPLVERHGRTDLGARSFFEIMAGLAGLRGHLSLFIVFPSWFPSPRNVCLMTYGDFDIDSVP
jgi:hypothetical protein